MEEKGRIYEKKTIKWCGGGLYSKEQFLEYPTRVIKEELVKIESTCPDIVVQKELVT